MTPNESIAALLFERGVADLWDAHKPDEAPRWRHLDDAIKARFRVEAREVAAQTTARLKVWFDQVGAVDGECPECGQVAHGQTGEYPCPACGLPTVHDSDSGIALIAEERERQRWMEGWDESHDDQHVGEQLAFAAVAYAIPERCRDYAGDTPFPWPWDESWWKPGGRIRELVKAGALVAAEIDRLLRLPAGEVNESSCASRVDPGSVSPPKTMTGGGSLTPSAVEGLLDEALNHYGALRMMSYHGVGSDPADVLWRADMDEADVEEVADLIRRLAAALRTAYRTPDPGFGRRPLRRWAGWLGSRP